MNSKDFNIEKFDKELDKVLTFWLNNAISNDRIIAEISIDNIPNPLADLGSMYLGRIIYGASAACKSLKTEKYRILADLSFDILITEFKNPDGGYFWAKNSSNNFLHDADNINMAQAFILYGLVEYTHINKSQILLDEIDNHSNFILHTLKDNANGGYLDGFNQKWISEGIQTKALGTHLHLLEAFTKLYEFNQNKTLVPIIDELINIILNKFITYDTIDCLHRLTPDWKPLENFVWAGHNAECSWILCKSASIIKNDQLLLECNSMAIKLTENVMNFAYDNMNGGVFNALKNNIPIDDCKVWWPQAETVTALLNCYEITHDTKYKNQAINLIHFISNNFIHENGEWLTEITNQGKPIYTIPKIHFWKALYHNVRYYVEVKERLD